MSASFIFDTFIDACNAMSNIPMKDYLEDINKSSEGLKNFKSIAWDNLHWYWQTSPLQKKNLLDFLVNLDKSRRVDPEAPRTQRVRDGITRIMESLCKNRLLSLLKGRLIPMGSSHNGTKIGDCDEFDFVYEMDVENLLSGKATFRNIKTDGKRCSIYLNESVPTGDLTFFKFLENKRTSDNVAQFISQLSPLYFNMTSHEDDKCLLNSEHIWIVFYRFLSEAASDLKLPPGWSHGGDKRPNFSDFEFNPPSIMLQFEYLFDDGLPPLKISVDFLPVIQIPVQKSDQSDFLDDFLLDNCASSSWIKVGVKENQSALYSEAEEAFLAKYPRRSIPKTLIRICKALCDLAKLSQSKRTDSAFLDGLESYPSADRTKDTDENVGNIEFVSSYILKRIVMTLMALDENKGHSWTETDLPDLVMSVYMLVNDVIAALENQRVNLTSNAPLSPVQKGTLYVDLEAMSSTCIRVPEVPTEPGLYENNGTEEDQLSLDFIKKEGASSSADCASASFENQGAKYHTSSHKPYSSPPKYYTLLKSTITLGKCQRLIQLFGRRSFSVLDNDGKLDLGISQLFQVLHAAFEGKKKTSFVSWLYPTCLDQDGFEGKTSILADCLLALDIEEEEQQEEENSENAHTDFLNDFLHYIFIKRLTSPSFSNQDILMSSNDENIEGAAGVSTEYNASSS